MHVACCNFILVNDQLARDSVIECRETPGVVPTRFAMSSLGMLNGALVAMGLPRVAAMWSAATEGDDLRPQTLGFCRYTPDSEKLEAEAITEAMIGAKAESTEPQFDDIDRRLRDVCDPSLSAGNQ